ncbi:hypothetical protein BpHYR1_025146 [Brachionus plicatilis]|uniref:Uncharacterized protein n=1 Tax=Brachionus plicatilis TaxID=10195 RepID=A0A3M7Q295_BRAPC|nr:hypothetical protein BpHYR1_025146 [Brachionus plicatilis]
MSDDDYAPLELYESQESDSEEVEERNILKKRSIFKKKHVQTYNYNCSNETLTTSKPTAKPARKRKQTQVTENTDEISNKKPKIGENQLKEDVVDLAKINTTTTSYTSFFLNFKTPSL